jgi:hypothetical protein
VLMIGHHQAALKPLVNKRPVARWQRQSPLGIQLDCAATTEHLSPLDPPLLPLIATRPHFSTLYGSLPHFVKAQ